MSEEMIEKSGDAGFWKATEEVMHFINALDSSGMDANAVRSAIYHKCLEMRPADSAYNPNERLREALEAIAKQGVGAASDWSVGECEAYWSATALYYRRLAREALSPLPQGED